MVRANAVQSFNQTTVSTFVPLVYKDTKRLRGRDRHRTIIAMQGVRTLPMISVYLDFKESALLSLSSNLIWGFEKKVLTISSEVSAKCFESAENNEPRFRESEGSI